MTREHPPDRPPCAIRAWFAVCDDGDFLLLPRTAPFWVLPPPADSSSLIYTTKPQIVWALLDAQQADVPCGVVGRAGLPHDSDASWLSELARRRRCVFLGDADPADLLIFAWLRARLSIPFGGLRDSLLHRCGC